MSVINRFGSASYRCDHCKRPMTFEEKALTIFPKGKTPRRDYCAKCKPLAEKVLLLERAA